MKHLAVLLLALPVLATDDDGPNPGDATSLPEVVSAGALVNSVGMERRDRGLTLAIDNAAEDECVSFRIDSVTNVEFVATLTDLGSDFDIRLYEMDGTSRTHLARSVNAYTEDERIEVEIDQGDYQICVEPFERAAIAGWTLDIDA